MKWVEDELAGWVLVEPTNIAAISAPVVGGIIRESGERWEWECAGASGDEATFEVAKHSAAVAVAYYACALLDWAQERDS